MDMNFWLAFWELEEELQAARLQAQEAHFLGRR
jgi:hypothetical protein